jgi:hypothetical protein
MAARFVSRFAPLLLALNLTAALSTSARADGDPWLVTRVGEEIRVAYRVGDTYPQVAALHTASSYLRLVPGPSAGWGTSVILLPSFWSRASCPGEGLCQGAPVEASWMVAGADLLISLTGQIGGLAVSETLRLTPPLLDQRISAHVVAQVSGAIELDERPGEAFKVVMLSSMHISETQWDAPSAGAGCAPLALPAEAWIADPPITTSRLWLDGGSSAWKTNAPAMLLTLDRPLAVTGWVTPTLDPNDDNVGLWAAANQVLAGWSYTVTAAAGAPRCSFLPALTARES